MSAVGSKCCEYCNDGEGHCIFPYYGVAPHTHAQGPVIGGTQIKPREQWPENFEEDSDCEGCGTYTYCPRCGAGG
jgi:hypothetical protein